MTIRTTKNYSRFKRLTGNRPINKAHKARLIESMRQNYRFTVVTVNENHEVIDGQHRIECAEELGLPVHYVVCKGYGLNDVQQLNANLKRWTTDDYLQGYCQMGKRDYLIYRDFKTTYKFGHNECICLLSGGNRNDLFINFKNGNFTIVDHAKAVDIAEKIISLEELYPGVRRRTFVFAMIELLKLPQFDFSRFKSKLERQRSKMHDCTSVDQYKDLIEVIYNHYTSDKVNLRFA